MITFAQFLAGAIAEMQIRFQNVPGGDDLIDMGDRAITALDFGIEDWD